MPARTHSNLDPTHAELEHGVDARAQALPGALASFGVDTHATGGMLLFLFHVARKDNRVTLGRGGCNEAKPARTSHVL